MLTHQNVLFKTSPKNVQPRIRKNGFPTFGPSVCDKRFCSISPKLSKRIIQNIPQKRPTKNSEKRPSQLLDHLLEKSKKIIQTFFQNIPKKWPTKNSAKWLFQLSDHLLQKSKKIIQTFFQNIPQKRPTKNSEKRLPNFWTIFCIFLPIYKTTP
jgi:hypothetical protein